jgi:hypothetical protein
LQKSLVDRATSSTPAADAIWTQGGTTSIAEQLWDLYLRELSQYMFFANSWYLFRVFANSWYKTDTSEMTPCLGNCANSWFIFVPTHGYRDKQRVAAPMSWPTFTEMAPSGQYSLRPCLPPNSQGTRGLRPARILTRRTT